MDFTPLKALGSRRANLLGENKPEIRLYLQIFDSLGIKRTSVWFLINRKIVNTILFRVDLIKFRKYFCVYIAESSNVHPSERLHHGSIVPRNLGLP